LTRTATERILDTAKAMRTNTQDTSQCVGKFQGLLTARKDEHFGSVAEWYPLLMWEDPCKVLKPHYRFESCRFRNLKFKIK
jgi:hypothetical protein